MSEDVAEAMAALWRSCREEAQTLRCTITLLEVGVAHAVAQSPAAEAIDSWHTLLAEQRAALEATRARGALIAALLDQGTP